MTDSAKKKTWDEEMKELFNDFKPKPEIFFTETQPEEIAPFWEPSPRLFVFWDISQKFFSLVNNKLVASVKDSNSTEQLIAVIPNNALDLKQHPIFMGLQPTTHAISCVKSEGGQPQLQLMERDIMDLHKQNDAFLNFSFYSKTDGNQNTCSFESAEFRGWFLSTSTEPDKPIGLSRREGPGNILFYFEKKR